MEQPGDRVARLGQISLPNLAISCSEGCQIGQGKSVPIWQPCHGAEDRGEVVGRPLAVTV